MNPPITPWPLVPLGKLSENFDGVRVPVKEADRKSGPYPYYGASGIVDRVDGFLFDGEYLLVAEDGENLRTRQTPIAFMATGKFWVNNHAHIIRGNAQTNTRYLMYALWRSEIGAYLTGSTMPKLTQGNLNRIPLPAPPLPVQNRIAGILGSLDDKIELNRRTNETLEAMARTLFLSWFVDFDPVRSKADAQRPHGLDDATAKLFPDAFEPSALGPIPKGWRVGQLDELLTICRDGINPLDHPLEMFDHYSIPAFDEQKRPQQEAGVAIKSNKYVVPGSSVLLSKLNPRIPRVWFPTVCGDRRSVCSTEFLVCMARPDDTREFLHSYLSSAEFTEEFASLVTGTSGSHQRVKPDDVLRLKALLPDGHVVRAFGDVVQPIYRRVAANLEQSQTLATLRDALLPKLLSGEVRVGDSAPALEGVV